MTGPMSDEQLMAEVQAGSHDAVRHLFDRYRQPLFAFFISRVDSVDPAEDLVQSVFVRMWKYRRSYRPGRDLRPWLYRIARNVLAESEPAHRTESLPDDIVSANPTPPEQIEATDRAARVRRAVAQLPDPQREALVLSRWSGMGYRDIGKVLGCSEGAVKLRVFRALQTLRARLEPELEDHRA